MTRLSKKGIAIGAAVCIALLPLLKAQGLERKAQAASDGRETEWTLQHARHYLAVHPAFRVVDTSQSDHPVFRLRFSAAMAAHLQPLGHARIVKGKRRWRRFAFQDRVRDAYRGVLVPVRFRLRPTGTDASLEHFRGPPPNTSQPKFPMRTTHYYEWFPEGWTQEGIFPYTYYHPSLGFYNSGDPNVVRKHISAMLYGHIAVATYDWWGRDSNQDSRFPRVLALSRQTPLRWATFYEAEGYGNPSAAEIHADLLHLRDRFFSNPAYLRIENRPVVFAYGDDDTCDVTRRWHEANEGIGAYLVLSAFGTWEHKGLPGYDETNPGGVRVASGDVDGDRRPEIVAAPGPGAPPLVQVVHADGVVASFLAGSPGDLQGISVAAGDVDGDGRAEVITGSDQTGTIKVFSILDGHATELYAFAAGLSGARVAVGDIDADGRAEIVAGTGPGSLPTVKVFEPTGTVRSSFLAYEAGFTGGVSVAVGNVVGDARAEIITGTGNAQTFRSAEVRIFDGSGAQMHQPVFPYEGFGGGISVGAGDINGDGKGDLVTGADAAPHVRAIALTATGTEELASFYAFDPAFGGLVSVATADAQGSGRADVIAGAQPGHGGAIRDFYGFTGCADQPDSWHVYGSAQYVNSLPPFQFGISPGFNKIGTPEPGNDPLPRDLSVWRHGIGKMNESSAPWHIVFTFNEWGEGTAVESAREWKTRSGYGAYLDALHELP